MITVGLPVYNQNKILPVALEGLCRQQEAGEWELIVSSEDNVWGIVDSYAGRLREAGCVNIAYHKIKSWIPLPMKWQKIGRLMDKASTGMMLQAADCYSHPDRIKQSRQAMLEGYDWYCESVGFFYYIGKNLLVRYDRSNGGAGTCTQLNMCIAAKHANRLPDSDRKKSIDGWMFSTIPDPKKVYQLNRSHKGVDLHGMNNISKKRGKYITGNQKAFKKERNTIETIGLPKEVVKQIKELRNIKK